MKLFTYYIFDIVVPGIISTLYILFWLVLFSGIFGFILGVILYATTPGNVYSHPKFNRVLGIVVNIIRSIPVVIFLVLMIPVTRVVIGTAIGDNAAIFSMSIMCTPFMGRVMEGKLNEVDQKLVEVGHSMGLSRWQILVKIVIHAAIPEMVLGLAFAAIMFIGSISLAGMIGAGGIGKVALNYGYHGFNTYVMYGSVVLIALIVLIIQVVSRAIYRKIR
jgi:D-methionine transport system permease protein